MRGMHLTLKREASRPAKANNLQQQAVFDDFVAEYNEERPHEALGMKRPAELYTASQRTYDGITPLEYPFHDRTAMVTSCGRLCRYRKKINISQVFAGQTPGPREVEENTWLVSLMDYNLGYIDLEERSLQPLHNPFETQMV